MKTLPTLTFGVGDRFGLEGEAQLKAVMAIRERGVDAAPVWNKSFREHSLVGTRPEDVRAEADAAVAALGWKGPYFVDADHIRISNVDAFTAASDFFTIDVADAIGREVPADDCKAFAARHADLVGEHRLEGLDQPVVVTADLLAAVASKYLAAAREAGRVYRRILERRGQDDFATEVSMDETSEPQRPAELLAILAALADEKIPLQTIAPKFSGEFHKGVDYLGDPALFGAEFDADVAVVAFAVKAFGLPSNLKLSVHSGSDKFAIYPYIARSIRKRNAGVHIKTAGTTWLEEVAGLAASGGDGLALAKRICLEALPRIDELAAPYAAVLSIDRSRLPSADEIASWDADTFVGRLVHDDSCPLYSPDFRQFVHISYSVAAGMGATFTDAVKANKDVVGAFVTRNLLERHLNLLAE